MDMVKDKLISSDLQFGFKRNSSCSHAILALQAGVKHICDSGGTATLCALDISKAFDRVNFYGLFKILIDCLFPKCFIDLLLDWFSKCISCVRWNVKIRVIFGGQFERRKVDKKQSYKPT